MSTTFTERFLKDIANHRMTVIRDDDVNRHLRFGIDGTTHLRFDVITWRGHLLYTGDMGTFVFRRLDDMFQFFRGGTGRDLYSIDIRYWAEKLLAADRHGGFEQWDENLFKQCVQDDLDQFLEDKEWPAERKQALLDAVEEEVLRCAEDEHSAMSAMLEFSHDGFSNPEFYEHNCRDYTHHFKWCCHALRWAIAQYDLSKTSVPA